MYWRFRNLSIFTLDSDCYHRHHHLHRRY